MTLVEKIRNQLKNTIESLTGIENIPLFSKGKVRDIFELPDKNLLFFVSDRVSVFDRVVGTIPFKGQILNSIATWWFNEVSDITKHHLISTPHATCSVVKKLSPLPVEVIVRGYLTGASSTSILTAYKKGIRSYCGIDLPDGMTPHQKFKTPLITPTTKAEVGGHDELISRDEIMQSGLVDSEIYKKVEAIALKLFQRGSEKALERGLLLADTKYEFGIDEDSNIYLIDEVHTPDSSRYWYENDYNDRVKQGKSPRGLDKDFVRNYMQSQGYSGEGEIPNLPDEIRVEAAEKYIALFELLTGKSFEPDLRNPTTIINKFFS